MLKKPFAVHGMLEGMTAVSEFHVSNCSNTQMVKMYCIPLISVLFSSFCFVLHLNFCTANLQFMAVKSLKPTKSTKFAIDVFNVLL